jgi:hypothetical protein
VVRAQTLSKHSFGTHFRKRDLGIEGKLVDCCHGRLTIRQVEINCQLKWHFRREVSRNPSRTTVLEASAHLSSGQAAIDACGTTGYNIGQGRYLRYKESLATEILNTATQNIFDGEDTQKARDVLPSELHIKARGLLDRLNAATKPSDLRAPRGNRLHQLEGDRAGQ